MPITSCDQCYFYQKDGNRFTCTSTLGCPIEYNKNKEKNKGETK